MPSESVSKNRGSPIAAQAIAVARAARSAKRDSANATLRCAIDGIQRSGVSTLAGIAAALDSRGVRTPAGKTTWHRVQVARLLIVLRRNEARALQKIRHLEKYRRIDT
jgi:hypothetical protein